MSAAETSEGETLEGMTPFERRNMYQHRYSWFFWEFAHQSHTGECDVVQPAGDTRSNRVLTHPGTDLVLCLRRRDCSFSLLTHPGAGCALQRAASRACWSCATGTPRS